MLFKCSLFCPFSCLSFSLFSPFQKLKQNPTPNKTNAQNPQIPTPKNANPTPNYTYFIFFSLPPNPLTINHLQNPNF